ncbi:hypothetical protein ABZ848_42010 [Streptomyces sp. NPDC047081]|uniref:hypothetical protein n=1 Tax=Streptomyces sp. NPDC047081 TaxID=3154706 RepID=UPI0033E7AF9E
MRHRMGDMDMGSMSMDYGDMTSMGMGGSMDSGSSPVGMFAAHFLAADGSYRFWAMV